MPFDSLMLLRIASDLERLALGASVERVFATGREEVVLELRRRLPRPQIVLSCAADLGRVHLASEAQPRPEVRYPLGDVLRKHLRGATLTGVAQVSFDRLLRLEFANCSGLGPQSRATLVAEIMGRHGNLILLDEESRITACAKHVTAEVNRYREVLPGLEYTPPPGFHRLDPAGTTAEYLAHRARGESDVALRSFLRKTLMGASDLLLAEVTTRARLAGERFLDQLPPDWPETLVAALADMLAEAREGGPGFIYRPAGRPTDVGFAYPVVLQSNPQLDCERAEDLSAALEAVTGRQLAERAALQARGRLAGFARRALKRAAGREEQRRRGLAQGEDADALRRRGELILANLRLIPPGAEQVTVPDYGQPGVPQVELHLDPNYSAQQNARDAFHRYRRARRIQEQVPPLLEEARREREYLEGVLDDLERAESLEDLRQVEEELLARGHIGRQAGQKRRPAPRSEVKLSRLPVADGPAILYGKTGTQNDELVRLADGDDLWFHVKDAPGGHVLIRTGGRPEAVPPETLEAAAALAAALSRRRTEGRVEVNFALAKHLRKPRGAPPGFATYTDFKTLAVRPKPPGERRHP